MVMTVMIKMIMIRTVISLLLLLSSSSSLS